MVKAWNVLNTWLHEIQVFDSYVTVKYIAYTTFVIEQVYK